MTERGSVAVIGAGPAGLAAAWQLASGGRAVRVYEARDRVGGRLRTEEVSGSTADAVVQLLSADATRTRELLMGMGLSDRLVEVPGRDAIWRGGRAHGLRYGSAASMAASGALPTGLKLRLGIRYLPFLERHAAALDLSAPVRAAEAGLDGESIGSWGRRELGEDFVELMAYPLLASYYGVTPEETSAALFHALARAGLHVSILGVRGGVGPLAAAMARALTARGVEVRPGASVDGLEASASGVRVRVADGVEDHAAAVVAVPAPAAARLVPEAGWLADVRTRSTATLVLAVDGALDTGWFGLTIPRRTPPGDVLAAVCVQSAKRTGIGADDGVESLVVIPAPAVGAEWAMATPAAALAAALPRLELVLPGIGDRVRGSRLVRLVDEVFVPAPGHFDRLRSLDPTPIRSRIALAGDYLVAPTVEGAVRSGLAAGRRLSRARG